MASLGWIWFSGSWSLVVSRIFSRDCLLTALASHCWTLAGDTVHHVIWCGCSQNDSLLYPVWGIKRKSKAQPHSLWPHLRSLSASSLSPVLNIYLWIFFPACVCITVCAIPLEARRLCLNWSYRTLWATKYMWGVKSRSPGRTAGAPNHWVLSPAPHTCHFCCICYNAHIIPVTVREDRLKVEVQGAKVLWGCLGSWLSQRLILLLVIICFLASK